MLLRLAEGTASVTELGSGFTLSQPAISKHIKVLERAGLISRSRSAQFRPCQLQPAPLKEVTILMEAFRRLAEERFDRLDDYLHKLQKTSPSGSSAEPRPSSTKGK